MGRSRVGNRGLQLSAGHRQHIRAAALVRREHEVGRPGKDGVDEHLLAGRGVQLALGGKHLLLPCAIDLRGSSPLSGTRGQQFAAQDRRSVQAGHGAHVGLVNRKLFDHFRPGLLQQVAIDADADHFADDDRTPWIRQLLVKDLPALEIECALLDAGRLDLP